MKQRIAVLFGGPTLEHDVSCISAASIVQHLDRERFEVTPVLVTREGVWVVGKDDPSFSTVDVPALLQMTGSPEVASDGAQSGTARVADSIAGAIETIARLDIVLPAFHGPYGEGGKVQALLDLIGVPYIGSGMAASAAGMDKHWTKTILIAAGLTVAEGVLLNPGETDLSEADRARLGLPVFVKPVREGSSIGVSRVDDWTQLDDALALAHRSDAKVLIEGAVVGRELDVAVLEQPDGKLVCGPPLEIMVEAAGRFFDYDAKYRPGSAELRVPADLDPETTARLQDHAIRAFRALGCAGLLRVDFFLRAEGDRLQPVVNEVNTFPGFTAMSQYPRIWKAAGLSFTELLSGLVDTALGSPQPAPVAASKPVELELI